MNITLEYQDFFLGGVGKRMRLKIIVADSKQKDNNLYLCGMFFMCF